MEQTPAAASRRYSAAISYRRKDGALYAAQLRSALKRYQFPRGFVAEPLRDIYLDKAYQRADPDFFRQAIEPALEGSDYLILVVTPSVFERTQAGAPNWVEREIRYFESLGRRDRVLIARADAEPGSPLPPFLGDYEAADQVDIRGLGSVMFWRWKAEVSHEIIRFIATLIGSDRLPELRREEARHRRRLAFLAIAMSLAIAAVTSGLAFAAYRARSAEQRATVIAQHRTIDAYRAAREREAARRLAETERDRATDAARRESIAKNDAFRNELRAEQERNSALARESQLLADESNRARAAGRFAEAIEYAVQALANENSPGGRPYVPQAEAALEAAIVKTPLRHRTARNAVDLAGVWLDDAPAMMLELTYDDRAVLHDLARGSDRPMVLPSATSFEQAVSCRDIFMKVFRCKLYHRGAMSAGCTNPEIYPMHSQGELLTLCSSRPANDIGRDLLQAASPFYADERENVVKEFESAEIENVSVRVRYKPERIKRLVAPDLDRGLVAAYSADEKSIRVADVRRNAWIAEYKLASRPEFIQWHGNALIAVLTESIEYFHTNGQHRSFAVRNGMLFETAPATTDRKWIGSTADGRLIVQREADGTIVTEGDPIAGTIVDRNAFDDLSGVYWTFAEKEQKSTAFSKEAPPNVRVFLRDLGAAARVAIDSLFQGRVSVVSLSAQHVAVIGHDHVTTVERASGRVVDRKMLPNLGVVAAGLMAIDDRSANLFAPFIRDEPRTDRRLLLVTDKGSAFLYGTESGQLKQIELGGASVEDVRFTPLSVLLLADEKWGDGFTHAFVLPRMSSPKQLMIRAPLEVGGRFDFAAVDGGGKHFVLSENKRLMSVFETTPELRESSCRGVMREEGDFFHMHALGAGRLIAVAEYGLCIMGFGAPREIPSEFPIDEFLHSRAEKRVIAGHDRWGVFTVPENGGTFSLLPDSEGEIGSIALSADERLLFAVIDKKVRVWRVNDGQLVFGAKDSKAVEGGVKLDAAIAAAGNEVSQIAVSRKEPLIAIASFDQNNARVMVLANYATGAVRRMAIDWESDGFEFSPDGWRLAVLSDKMLRVLDARTGAVVYERGNGGGIGYLKRVEFDRRGTHFMAVPNRDIFPGRTNAVLVWTLTGNGPVSELEMPSGVKVAAFSDDGETVVVGDDKGDCALFFTQDGKKLRTLARHEYTADFVAFTDGDRRIVTGDNINGLLRVFDTASGVMLLDFKHDWGISVNNAFGKLVPILPMPELNALYIAGRSGVAVLPFYFDRGSLRRAAEKIVSVGSPQRRAGKPARAAAR